MLAEAHSLSGALLSACAVAVGSVCTLHVHCTLVAIRKVLVRWMKMVCIVSACVYVSAHLHVCVCVCVCKHLCACVRAHLCVRVYVFLCVCVSLQRLEAVDEVVHRADVSSTMMQEKVRTPASHECVFHVNAQTHTHAGARIPHLCTSDCFISPTPRAELHKHAWLNCVIVCLFSVWCR
jgi:hypothetical protein